MASENKKKKLKNSFYVPSALKNKQHKNGRLKGGMFYTASDRQHNKKIDIGE